MIEIFGGSWVYSDQIEGLVNVRAATALYVCDNHEPAGFQVRAVVLPTSSPQANDVGGGELDAGNYVLRVSSVGIGPRYLNKETALNSLKYLIERLGSEHQ